MPGADRRAWTWTSSFAALGWAVGLATMSLFLVRESADDAYYVRLSSWIAAHGELPDRDVLFSDETFPAVIYPPVSALEALVGTVARATGLGVPDLTYLVVAPAAAAAVALATWRLLRRWNAPIAWLALSSAMVFLLLNAQLPRTVGGVPIASNLGLARTWQGKFIFATVLTVLLFALLHEYVARPGKRQLVLLASAGAAGVGLTASAVFVIPVIAVGCLAPVMPRSIRVAAAGLAAAVAYPFATAVVTAAIGGHAVNPNPYLPPGTLARIVLGTGFLAFVALLAVLAGPALVRRADAALMAAGAAAVLVLVLAPPATKVISDLTGLGRVQWRLFWAMPAAALLGVMVTSAFARARSPAVRFLPAAVLLAGLFVWGAPLFERVRTADEPSWKRSPADVEAARRVLAGADDGDVILAERRLSQTISIMDGSVTTVAPRPFYARALRDIPAAHVEERLLLLAFAERGLAGGSEAALERALHTVGVDLACLDDPGTRKRQVLRDAGYTEVFASDTLVCFRAGPQG